MEFIEHHAVVPGDDGESLLVADGRLPCVRGEVWRLPDVLDLLEPLVGRPPYLRLAAHATPAPHRILRLHVFDSAAGDADRVALEDAEELAPPELRPALGRWLAEQRGAPVPEARSAWARPGWLAEAEAWAGATLRPVRQWPLSAVLRGERPDGPVYFKAVFPLFHHEPAVTEALAAEHPTALPELVAVERERGWMLMRELAGTREWRAPDAGWARPLRVVGEIQRRWAGRRSELVALGAQDRSLATLAREVAGHPELERCLEELGRLGLPETVGHGDLHPGNFAFEEDGEVVVFDWSDACVNHPLFDLARFLHEIEDAEVRALLAEAWAEGWGERLPARALELADPLSCVHQAVSYRAIAAGVEPADRWFFAAEPERWLELAYDRARGKASQPG